MSATTSTAGSTAGLRTKRLGRAAIGMVTAAAVGSAALVATTGDAAVATGRQITGTWAVTVDPDGPPPPFASTLVYTATGSVVEATSNRPPSAVTAGLGAWERLGDGRFAMRMVKYRFDGATFLGTAVIEETSVLAPDGETYVARATTTLYDASGVAGPSFSSTARGERL